MDATRLAEIKARYKAATAWHQDIPDLLAEVERKTGYCGRWKAAARRYWLYYRTKACDYKELLIEARQLRAERDAALRRAEAAEARVRSYEEREAACCPEGVGFDDVIRAIRQRIAVGDEMVAMLSDIINEYNFAPITDETIAYLRLKLVADLVRNWREVRG